MAKQQPQQNKEDFTEAEYEKFRSELNLHILHKSYQVGSVAGTATGVVLALFSRKRGFLNTLGTTSLMGTVLAAFRPPPPSSFLTPLFGLPLPTPAPWDSPHQPSGLLWQDLPA